LALTSLLSSNMEGVARDTFPAILAISNTLIHARVGLGWSQDSAVARKPRDQTMPKSGGNAVWYVFLLKRYYTRNSRLLPPRNP
jgi:hypothetical protein